MPFYNKQYFLKQLILLAVIAACFCSMAFSPGKSKTGLQKEILGSKYSVINDTLYAGVYEVSNAEYRDFLNALNDSVREVCGIDTAQWVRKFPFSYNNPMAVYYHSRHNFDSFPVVNISFYAARKYCAWLTYRYAREGHKQKLLFRLPSEEEWNLLAHANPVSCLPFPLFEGRDGKGKYLENVRWITDGLADFAVDGGFYTLKGNNYVPNDFGLYQVIGNAAEMTDRENIEKGGSWFDLLGDCGIDKQQNYETPDPRVGFRVVVQVLPN